MPVPSFHLVAYTGAVMQVDSLLHPVVLDLAGIHVPQQHRPVLRGHDHQKIVGHTDRVRVGKLVEAWGIMSGVGLGHADEIIGNAARGFEWQVSMGSAGIATEFLRNGEKDKVNGFTVEGPLYIFRETQVNEFSFCPLGADGDTRATITGGTSPRSNSSRPTPFRSNAVSPADRLLCNIAAAANGLPFSIQTTATKPGTGGAEAELRQLVADGFVQITAGRPVPTRTGERRATELQARRLS